MTKRKVVSGLILTVLLLLLIHQYQQEEFLPTIHPTITARTKATMEEKRENKQIAREYSRALGYSRRETACLVTLWTRESRFDHLAKNRHGSSAYGIAQLLGERSGQAELQILHGIRYIEHRYRGSACRALAHHRSRGWY
ncbi:hypothetical protein CCP3SC1AL1_2640010 [Gammaproteobacteria bacterium]